MDSRHITSDGFIWSYELTPHALRLRLFRCFTVACIRLENVQYIRQRGDDDLARWWRDFFLRPFRCWYWPHPFVSHRAAHSTAYIIQTRQGRRIYVRLRGAFHWHLRDAVGRCRATQMLAASAPLDGRSSSAPGASP